ncbi:MAG: hypothetical protein CMJ94_07185 [Planctomycetes bacterium]|nr:hypothetical protein [Planctomycetota bacterium]
MKTILTLFALILGASPALAQSKAINLNCPIGKEAIDQETFVEYQGHTIGFCCAGCDTKFLAWDEARKDAFVKTSLAAQQQPKPEPKQEPKEEQAKPAAFVGDPYLLETCLVSGKKLGSMGKPIDVEVEGRAMKLCCKGCIKKLKAEPKKYLDALDRQIMEQQAALYPTKKCLISGELLFEDGEYTGVDIVVKNRLFRVCCKRCASKVKADPAPAFAKLDAMVIEAQSKAYPLETCLVREKSKLGSMGDPVKRVVGMRLVQFCCDSCLPKFEKDPAAYLKRLDKKVTPAAQSHKHDGSSH